METFKNNPMALMTSIAVDSALETNRLIHDLISKYKANNIDVVPISELEDCVSSGIKKAFDEDSLTSKIIKEN